MFISFTTVLTTVEHAIWQWHAAEDQKMLPNLKHRNALCGQVSLSKKIKTVIENYLQRTADKITENQSLKLQIR